MGKTSLPGFLIPLRDIAQARIYSDLKPPPYPEPALYFFFFELY
jgi:hypothetical protein